MVGFRCDFDTPVFKIGELVKIKFGDHAGKVGCVKSLDYSGRSIQYVVMMCDEPHTMMSTDIAFERMP
jgi:hypothetical protein